MCWCFNMLQLSSMIRYAQITSQCFHDFHCFDMNRYDLVLKFSPWICRQTHENTKRKYVDIVWNKCEWQQKMKFETHACRRMRMWSIIIIQYPTPTYTQRFEVEAIRNMPESAAPPGWRLIETTASFLDVVSQTKFVQTHTHACGLIGLRRHCFANFVFC